MRDVIVTESITSDDIVLMTKLEGLKTIAYDCTAGKRTVGIGFNMESYGARKVWDKEEIPEDFDKVFNREQELSTKSINKLFLRTWKWCQKKAIERSKVLGVDYSALPEWHKFILADIAYNTGSVTKWKKVFLNTKPYDVLVEARRRPYEVLDSRVAKIGYHFWLVRSLSEAQSIGIKYARHIL